MGTRIDDLEKSISDLMEQAGSKYYHITQILLTSTKSLMNNKERTLPQIHPPTNKDLIFNCIQSSF